LHYFPYTASLAGMIIGSYFWGTFADIKGRIKALLLCQLVNAVFIVLSSVSQNLPFLICMRLFSGFGWVLRLYTQTIHSDYTLRLCTQTIYSDYIQIEPGCVLFTDLAYCVASFLTLVQGGWNGAPYLCVRSGDTPS